MVGIAAGIGVVSSIFSFGSKRKARRSRRRAQEEAQRRAKVEQIMARRQGAAAARREQANAVIAGLVSGGSQDYLQSSAAAAGAASLSTQEGTNQSNQLQQIGSVAVQQGNLNRAARAESSAAVFDLVGNIAGSIGSIPAGGKGQ